MDDCSTFLNIVMDFVHRHMDPLLTIIITVTWWNQCRKMTRFFCKTKKTVSKSSGIWGEMTRSTPNTGVTRIYIQTYIHIQYIYHDVQQRDRERQRVRDRE